MNLHIVASSRKNGLQWFKKIATSQFDVNFLANQIRVTSGIRIIFGTAASNFNEIDRICVYLIIKLIISYFNFSWL